MSIQSTDLITLSAAYNNRCWECGEDSGEFRAQREVLKIARKAFKEACEDFLVKPEEFRMIDCHNKLFVVDGKVARKHTLEGFSLVDLISAAKTRTAKDRPSLEDLVFEVKTLPETSSMRKLVEAAFVFDKERKALENTQGFKLKYALKQEIMTRFQKPIADLKLSSDKEKDRQDLVSHIGELAQRIRQEQGIIDAAESKVLFWLGKATKKAKKA